MSVELTMKYAPYADDLFKAESKRTLLTNQDFDWTGAHTVKVYKISTAEMNNYSRNRVGAEGESTSISRFGELYDLSATTEEMVLSKDRSFIFNVDRMDADETRQALAAASALARQLREVVIPEVDTYIYGKMVTGAGTTATAAALTKDNIYEKILAGSAVLDDNEIPETERAIVVNPAVYGLLKQAVQFDNTEVGAEMRQLGVVGYIDGMPVVRVPSVRLPANFGFMIAHPSATVCALKLEDYGIHSDTVLSSGDIVTGRVVYDAFVLENKAKGIYYQPISAAAAPVEEDPSADDSSSGGE